MTLRVVIDPNVLIAALISRRGAPARVVRAAVADHVTAVSCPRLVHEFTVVAHRDKFKTSILKPQIAITERWLRIGAELHADPREFPAATRDPADDYLVALARTTEADHIVTGDRDLLEADLEDLTILTPAALLSRIEPSRDA